jgi:two-component system, cell cycle response regulator DivK
MMNDKKILIVEDNIVNLGLLSMVLQKLGYTLLTARDGKEAVDTAERELPDLILMDLQLPVMNGYDAMIAIKGSTKTSRIKVAAVTAQSQPEAKTQALNNGFDGFISKPIDIRTINQTIEEILKAA